MMPSRKIALALLLAAVMLGASGCKKRTVHAAPPVPTPPPAEPAPAPAPTPEPEPKPEPKPETPPEAPPALPPVAPTPTPKPAPVKPKPDPVKPAPPPQLTPGLSPEEQASAERRTNEDIRVAEHNLQAAYGKQLNTPQHDLVEKIRGFLAQAREAMRSSDWVRARNLAQKAHVLSVELINSL